MRLEHDMKLFMSLKDEFMKDVTDDKVSSVTILDWLKDHLPSEEYDSSLDKSSLDFAMKIATNVRYNADVQELMRNIINAKRPPGKTAKQKLIHAIGSAITLERIFPIEERRMAKATKEELEGY